ncbi:MAG TPA: hypothetical protein VJA21_12985 [Verrucomicrobiae bacterium]
MKRELFQVGYNAAFEGHPPLSAYAFYYHNQPEFLRTNFTLRLAVAPTYADSELGIRDALGPDTDVGLGLGGGGYGDSYYEIQNGTYLPKQSFDGYGGQASINLYHLFNPERQIPLNGVVRGIARFATYDPTSDTDPNFRVPDDMGIFSERAGLRWGGREPTLFPSLAMELSIWQQTDFRTRSDIYGYGDRKVKPRSYLFWMEAFLAYKIPDWKHTFSVNLTAGTSIDADRFSAYRLGGFLPMVSEFPLSLPGYYYQELTAKDFLLVSGSYAVPLDRNNRWNISANAATALIEKLPGLEQPGHWHSGAGAGLFYTTPVWRVMVGYGYGIDAQRTHGVGAHSIGFLLQFDLAPAREAFFKPEPPGRWRGLQRVFGVLGS